MQSDADRLALQPAVPACGALLNLPFVIHLTVLFTLFYSEPEGRLVRVWSSADYF